MVTPRVKRDISNTKKSQQFANPTTIVLFFIFGLSGSALCFTNALDRYDGFLLSMACSIAFFGFGMFATNLTRCFRNKQDLIVAIVSILVAFITVYRLSKEYDTLPLSQNVFALPAISLIIFFVIREALLLAKELFKDRETLIFWLVTSLVISATIVILYTLNDFFYTQVDRYLSTDSGLCTSSYKTITSIYVSIIDVKHPILWIVYYPVYSVSYYVSKFISINTNLTSAIFYQLTNIQFIILTALLLSKITSNKFIKYIFLSTAPAITLLMVVEKFQLILFVLTYMVYCLKENRISRCIWLGGISSSLMPTTSILVLGILFFRGIDIRDRLVIIAKTAGICVLIVVSLGFIDGLLNFTTYIQPHLAGNTTTYTPNLLNLLFAFTHFIKNMIFQDNIEVRDPFLIGQKNVGKPVLWWEENFNDYASIIGIVIILLAIYCMIKFRKQAIVSLSAFWMIFSAIFIIVIKWSWYESPLFSWYFSWSLLLILNPLLEDLSNKLSRRIYLYAPLIAIIFIFNLTQDIGAVWTILTIL